MLQDLSPEAFETRMEHDRAVLRDAAAIRKSGDLSRKDRSHLDLFMANVEDTHTKYSPKSEALNPDGPDSYTTALDRVSWPRSRQGVIWPP